MRRAAQMLAAMQVIAFSAGACVALHAEETTIDDLELLWSKRETATETARVSWVETIAQKRFDPQTLTRAVPVVEERQSVLWIGEGPNVRYESIPVRDSTEPDDSLTRAGLAVSTYNGKRNAYYTAALGPDDHHRGSVFDAEVYDELANYHLRAIILCYRPSLLLGPGLKADRFRIVERDVTFAERKCVVIEETVETPIQITNRYWVDVDRGGLILQHVESAAGSAGTQLKIKYNHDDDGWTPATWDALFTNGAMSTSASVVDHTLNEPLPAEMFEIAWPPGTVVIDRDLREQWRVRPDETKEKLP